MLRRRRPCWATKEAIRQHLASLLMNVPSDSVELWMATPCAGWVQSCMPARHRDHTPPRLMESHSHLGGGTMCILRSLLFTTFQHPWKWSQLMLPFSNLQKLCSVVLHTRLLLHFWRQKTKPGLLKTLGF